MQAEVTGKGGTEAQRIIFNRLDDMFGQTDNVEEYEI
jgi:hypothetical protein